jgi:DNA-binding NarL/FixJ family response regulator
MKLKIAAAEDNANLARALKDNLGLFPGIELLFIAQNGKELLQKLPQQTPDLILMDINMPVMDGIEATKKVKHHFPNIKIVMLTVFDEEEKIFQSILSGATGYLLKDEKPARLLVAIEEAMEGGAPMSPTIAMKTLQFIKNRHRIEEGGSAPQTDFGLSGRELEILQKISEGKNYQEIAEVLFISPKTVRKHIENIYAKLQVHNKVEAVQVAKKNRLISLFF